MQTAVLGPGHVILRRARRGAGWLLVACLCCLLCCQARRQQLSHNRLNNDLLRSCTELRVHTRWPPANIHC